jgi:hypothetical protein
MVINKLLNEVSIQKIWKKFTQHEEEFADKQMQIDEITSNLGGLRFGYDSEGWPGVIMKGQDGADTVVPFPNDDRIESYKQNLVDTLVNTGLGLTYDSTWAEIFAGLNYIFPETLNVLAKLGYSNIYRKGGNTTWTSAEFDITTFNTMTVSASWNAFSPWYSAWGSKPAQSAYLVTPQGNISLLRNGAVDISGYKGSAYISIHTGQRKITASTDGSNRPETMTSFTSYAEVNITKLILQV